MIDNNTPRTDGGRPKYGLDRTDPKGSIHVVTRADCIVRPPNEQGTERESDAEHHCTKGYVDGVNGRQ